MAGMEFEYDEKGGTFYYFLLSFLALVLIPATYYLWPRKVEQDEAEKQKKKCLCDPCMIKRQRLKAKEPWKNFQKTAIKLGLIIGWIITIFVAYKASQVELDFTEFDPFAELEIDRGASDKEIRKAYRTLSLQYHPDKAGDPKKFMRITRAYKALTDEEAKKNWEEHGNPDGPGATSFGIALPKWLIESENSVWVLAAYGLVFMIILPVTVGSWWYKSIKFSAEQILMDTTQLYVHFFQKTPNMMLKRVVMILGSSLEFEKGHNNEVAVRETDNEEIPMLMRDLPHLNEKNKEKPLCYPFSVKARALFHAHFSRLELPPNSLELDKQYVLTKAPYLLNEMINIVAQLVAWYHHGRVSRLPRLDTVENIMKVSQMCIQALWDNKSPILQLPHISEDMLRHFITKRRNIRSIQQFVSMKDEDRRQLLRTLNEAEYRDVMNVCASMPYITMEVKSQVIDEEDQSITAGSIVTVSVTLIRKNMEVLFNKDDMPIMNEIEEIEPEMEDDSDVEEEKNKENEVPEKKKDESKGWVKPQKKKGKGAKGKSKKTTKPVVKVVKEIKPAGKEEDKQSSEKVSQNGTPNSVKSSRKRHKEADGSSDEGEMSGSDDDGNISDDDGGEGDHKREDDEEEWNKFQQEFKKENQLEAKSKETHQVHCPYFPVVKYEWWWLYVADRRAHSLITSPVQVCSLRDVEEVQLKFYAPAKPGLYQYSVNLKSDSYFDFDLSTNIKLDVKEAKKVEDHPQWDISDDEENKEEVEVSEEESDYSDESDED